MRLWHSATRFTCYLELGTCFLLSKEPQSGNSECVESQNEALLNSLAPFLVRSNQRRLGKDVRVHFRFGRSLVTLIKPIAEDIEGEARCGGMRGPQESDPVGKGEPLGRRRDRHRCWNLDLPDREGVLSYLAAVLAFILAMCKRVTTALPSSRRRSGTR